MDTGLIQLASLHSVGETLNRLEEIVRRKGLTIMARVDHSAQAVEVGLRLRPTVLLVFGSPTSGTPMMVASPTLGLDLPLKVLVWRDDQRQVWLSYNSPEYLALRHDIPAALVGNISGIAAICNEAAGPAARGSLRPALARRLT